MRRSWMWVGLVAWVYLAAAPALAADDATARAPHCDGTDPFLFDEMQKNGLVGYGETWDEHTCDDGAEVYSEGATSRWRALRTKRVPHVSPEDQMLALIMPMVVIGGLGAIFLGAAALAALMRLRKRVVLSVPCPACDAELSVVVDDPNTHSQFCALCGAPCSVSVRGTGAAARAFVVDVGSAAS